MTHSYNVACIVGARPNFMKMAPILRAFAQRGDFKSRLIHTGQHYDVEMNAIFFEQLGIPEPDLNLDVGSGSQTVQTAKIMIGLEQAFLAQRPDMVVVVGDVNSTLAAALVAAKLRIPLAHVEAGLRSFDMNMPEEVNRLVTDRLSDLLLTTEAAAREQLILEGVAEQAIHFTGNVMIDTLLANLDRAVAPAQMLVDRGLASVDAETVARNYALVTLHRPSNVDVPSQLESLLRTLVGLSQDLPLIFTMHPRTRAQIKTQGLEMLIAVPGFHVVPPLSYFEMLGAVKSARMVITDSGGLQEETTALGVPCLTVRDNTERPITITHGTNTLVGSSAQALGVAAYKLLSGPGKVGRTPEFWDGHAAERIAAVIAGFLHSKPS